MPECRVYVDMVADMFHYGHVRFLKQCRAVIDARGQTPVVVVGITADEYLPNYKRTPVLANAERAEVVAACRYVDEVIPNAPLVTTAEFMDKHRCAAVAHGDDMTPEQVALYYQAALDRGCYITVPYTRGISTTEILQRAAARVMQNQPTV